MNVWDCQQVLMYKQIGRSAYSLSFSLKNKKTQRNNPIQEDNSLIVG